jgi:hypothetical protein
MSINTYLKPLHPLVKYGHQCLERNVTQNLNHRLKNLFCSLRFCSLGIRFTWPKRKTRSALGPGSKVDVVRSSGRFRPDIVSISLRCMAWHCQHVTLIFVDLLHREERLSLEKYDQDNIDSSTSAPWTEH